MSLKSVLRIFALACLLNLLNSVFALASDGRLHDFFREQWTTRDGLPHNTINSIAQTKDGYLWFATWEGVSRFNGREFKAFGRGHLTKLPDDGVYTLEQNCDGGLLVASARGGISIQHNGAWQALEIAPALIRSMLCDKQGNLWFGTDGAGLVRQDNEGNRTYFAAEQGLSSLSIFSLQEDAQGRIWVGTANGLFVVDDKQKIRLTEVPGLPSGPIFALTLDNQQRLLVGTEAGAYRQDRDNFTLLHGQLTDIAISKLLMDEDELWLGTIGHGVYRLGRYGLEHLGQQDGLPNERITAMFKDSENSLWLGTNGGLFRLRDAAFRTLTQAQGLTDNFVRTVLVDTQQRVWIGTSKGVNLIDESGIRVLNGERISQTILSLAEAPDGGLWVGTFTHGLVKWQDGQEVEFIARDDGLLSNEVRAILPAKDGRLWVATASGVNIFKGKQFKTLKVEDGLPSDFAVALLETSQHGIWIGTATGVARWQDGKVYPLDISGLDGAQFVFDLYEQADKQALWMATDRGLIRYRYRDGHLAILGRDIGMPFDKYFQVSEDLLGNLWLSSNRGVLRLSFAQVAGILDGQGGQVEYSLFGESDGMVSAQANGGSNPAMSLNAQGHVWVATSKGASVVKPERLRQFGDYNMPVVIEHVQVDGKDYIPSERLILPEGVSRIEFQFAGLGYVVSQRIRYRTRLDGFDKAWVSRGTHNSAEYTSLAPGEYRFHVMASYPNGEWVGTDAQITFYIPPRVWQRTGFWLALSVVFVLLLIVAVKWRLLALQRASQRLQDKVEEQTLALRQQTFSLQQANWDKSQLLEKIRQQAEAFEQQARQDSLTGLANRRAFDEALQREFSRANRQTAPFCLLLLDLDHFKQINDNWSHAAGDAVLQLVANTLRHHSREVDLVARWGGEEFAVLLPNTDREAGVKLAERLRLAVMHINCSEIATGLTLSASLGLAEYRHGQNTEQLLQAADTALYQAKQGGRNMTCVAS
ncbi:ligand-binding sensor domain-containing diguanylate cyclase [Bowmanella yangjiangensis]|uniref:diguanylate cyclase n=1 Tax=Bowmanella yangjiangensis TaxID=2811230 RepID=A0ABS3CXQ7_9ALTE|nr:ligand-binding sensor domain-containing diguanylate cyclase [Bowmanella yangjiangensis]MBN7821901.1 diguanylate cyclase [Bowmanella yangjiangensis]